MYVCPACMLVRESIGVTGTEVTEDYELPCGCWKLNPGPPQEQKVLLILRCLPGAPFWCTLIPSALISSLSKVMVSKKSAVFFLTLTGWTLGMNILSWSSCLFFSFFRSVNIGLLGKSAKVLWRIGGRVLREEWILCYVSFTSAVLFSS